MNIAFYRLHFLSGPNKLPLPKIELDKRQPIKTKTQLELKL
jgi:hypothetical protein